MVLDGVATDDEARPTDDGDLRFTRRNGVETLCAHWGLLVALGGLFAALNWADALALTPSLRLVALLAAAIQTIAAVVVTVLVVMAVRRNHTYDKTDVWDGPFAAVPVLALIVSTVA